MTPSNPVLAARFPPLLHLLSASPLAPSRVSRPLMQRPNYASWLAGMPLLTFVGFFTSSTLWNTAKCSGRPGESMRAEMICLPSGKETQPGQHQIADGLSSGSTFTATSATPYQSSLFAVHAAGANLRSKVLTFPFFPDLPSNASSSFCTFYFRNTLSQQERGTMEDITVIPTAKRVRRRHDEDVSRDATKMVRQSFFYGVPI